MAEAHAGDGAAHAVQPPHSIDLHFDGALQRFSNWDGPAPYRAGGGE